MRRFAPFVLLLPLLGCGVDSTAVPNPFVLFITGPRSEDGTVYQNGARRCELMLTATAQGGEEGDYALWIGLEVRRFDYDEGRWTETITYVGNDIYNFWGSDRVLTGSSANSASLWDDPDGHTFQLTMTFVYQASPTLEQRSIVHTFDCN